MKEKTINIFTLLFLSLYLLLYIFHFELSWLLHLMPFILYSYFDIFYYLYLLLFYFHISKIIFSPLFEMNFLFYLLFYFLHYRGIHDSQGHLQSSAKVKDRGDYVVFENERRSLLPPFSWGSRYVRSRIENSFLIL